MQHLNLSQRNAQFPDSMTDVRGFEVRTRDSDEKIGKVDDLIVANDGRIRYLDVDVGGFFNSKHVALPVGVAQVDRANDVVWVTGLTKDQIKDMPDFDGDASSITNEYESGVRRTFASGGSNRASLTDTDLYDQGRFYAERGGAAAREGRLVLSEEQLNVGKRQVQAGEVGIRKAVETEHVTEEVTLTHEEARIERRPVTDRNAVNTQIGEQEIRVPLMAEEAVVEKRVVPTEEVVLRKEQVAETKTVEADLQRERLDESGLRGATTRDLTDRDVTDVSASGTRGRKARGVADKVADAVDDVKDRVDGNPASRPGPDATDRRF
jgi:uncharacterized protein (TIGR02271 family)